MEKNDFHSKYDQKSLIGVRAEYDVMKTLIGGLSQKLTKVSSHVEKEFLSAYRVHMLSVQEELRSLKSQVVIAEVALNEDEEVSRLEQEVTWFSDEALRLKNAANSMRKDMQHVVTRIDALREQREYLSGQLKTTLKRTRILEAEMGLIESQQQQQTDWNSHETGNYHNSEMHESNPGGFKEREAASGRAGGAGGGGGGGSLATSSSRQQLSKAKSTTALPRIKMKNKGPAIEDVLLGKPKGAGVSGTGGAKLSAIDELRQLEDSRLGVELDLESALRGVFASIIDRKVQAVTRTGKVKEATHGHDEEWKIDAASGGISGLGIAHFSDTDRLSAIATFLGTPASFQKIVEGLEDEFIEYS